MGSITKESLSGFVYKITRNEWRLSSKSVKLK